MDDPHARHGKGAAEIVGRQVLVAVDVDRVVSPRVFKPGLGIENGVVVVRYPVVGLEVGEIDFIGKALLAVFIGERICPTHARLDKAAFAPFHGCAEPLVQERGFGLHADDPVEGIGPIECRTGTDDQVDAVDIELRGAQEVAQGEVQAGRLVVHPVNNLQGTHRAGTVEATGIDDLEPQTGRRKVHIF